MIKIMLSGLLIFSLLGCLEEYQFGDVSRTIESYCAEHADDLLRQEALKRLHQAKPYLSEEGFCGYIEE